MENPRDNLIPNAVDEVNREIDNILSDPAKKAAMLQRLARLDASRLAPSGSNGGGDGVPPSSGSITTPSAAFPFPAPHGAFANPAAWYTPPPFHVMPPQAFAWPFSTTPQAPQAPPTTEVSPTRDGADNTVVIDQQEDGNESDRLTESDVVDLLGEQEATQFRELEFDPKVKDDTAWQPTEAMLKFLEKHFNQSLTEEERKAILNDFPIPKCNVLQAPKLDPEVKDQLRKKGRNPQFGTERCLYRVQEQLLEVTGPLTCLWADLQNPDAELKNEEIILLLQRALVLVGSTYHSINVERRRTAWSRINPSLKSLAEEEYDKREGNLFGPGFLEKASKKVEAERAMAKVTSNAQAPRKRAFEEDPSDLRRFLSKGAPAQYGGKGKQRQQKSYNQSIKNNFKKPRPGRYQSRQ